MNNNVVVGVDIGGSHITAALINLEEHAVVQDSLVRRHINSKASTEEIINEWSEAILDCKVSFPHTSDKLGIAMPGPFDYQNGISYINGLDKYEALYGLNVKALLAARLRIAESNIVMMNDASCFLKGEVFGGAARDCKSVIGVTLGTGLGSAVLKQDTLQEGFLFCAPYRDLTTEEYISTRWFKREYEKRTGKNAENVKVLSEMASEDLIAAQLFEEFGANFGEVLSGYIKEQGAEVVVIGGNIVHSWELFMPSTKKALARNNVGVIIVKAALGEQAALMGAGSLCVSG